MSLFKNKYRIELIRVQGYDYSDPGIYFVTICCYQKQHFFGEINNGHIILSPMGKIAKQCWLAIPKHYPNIKLDTHVIMPNHIHGLIEIRDTKNVETHNCASLRGNYNKFGPQSKNLAAIIRAYKSTVKKFTNDNNFEFHWQSRYYDHIIRNDYDLNRIREYIKNNPQNWQDDRNNALPVDN